MKKLKILLIFTLILSATIVRAQESFFIDNSPEIVMYKAVPQVLYGQGKIMKDGKLDMKDLTMDVYYPIKESSEPRPAVILMYGGSFHRGNPRVPYVGFGSQTTTMGQYAMRYAEEGFVCFTINYRLAPDIPVISSYEDFAEDDLDVSSFKTAASIAQINSIRRQMGLDDVTKENVVPVLKNAILAAAEDLRMAIRHIKNSSEKYNIDPKKIAIGGFSAGAVSSINVAYGMKEEVAAVFTNSGFPALFKMDKLMTQSSKYPPILIFMAENDLPTVSFLLPPFVQLLDTLNVDYTFNWIPGYGHFYPSGATSLSDKGDKMSIEQRTIKFLKKKLQ